MNLDVRVISDERTGRLKARTVDIQGWGVQIGEEAAKTNKTIIRAKTGGSVCNSYGYSAETEVCLVVAIPDGIGNAVVAVYAAQIAANKVSLAGAAGACMPCARPVFDWRYGDAATDAARKSTIAQAITDLIADGVPTEIFMSEQQKVLRGITKQSPLSQEDLDAYAGVQS